MGISRRRIWRRRRSWRKRKRRMGISRKEDGGGGEGDGNK